VQDAALSPGQRRRVVVSTAVAESSPTVPGVRIVVDAGLSREPRTDLARGLGALVTVRVSRAAADERADLTGFVLELACWGDTDGTGLQLPDPSPPAALAVARETLEVLGALDSGGRVTDRGRAIAAPLTGSAGAQVPSTPLMARPA
jgi:ATP-dependent helicase HrpB